MWRALLIASALVCRAAAAPIEYRIRPVPEARFALEVHKTGLMSGKKHLFVFERYSGVLQYDKERPVDSRVELEIEAKSAVLKDEWIGEKNKSKVLDYALVDMLEAARHPVLKFTSSGIAAAGGNRFKVVGTLEIRGIPKPAEVDVTVGGDDADLRLDGTSTVKLSSYGLKPRSRTLGIIGTKDEMTVSFRVRAVSSR